MSQASTADLAEALFVHGLVDSVDIAFVPLSGGVSCDVWRVDDRLVVKRALPRLRVAAEWHAPVDRIDSEARWLRHARTTAPEAAPEVLLHLPEQHALAMRFVPDAPVWKDELFAGRVDGDFASAIGRQLARIHAASTGKSAEPDTMSYFVALRVDPFIRHVAEHEPALAPALLAVADHLVRRRTALVHGDVSPKNILVAAAGPVFLDAECAVFGDPAFDLAFCATHLLLKAVVLSDARLRDAARALVDGYRGGVTWEPFAGLASRAGTLVAALLLARVEGKSPAPYLTDPAQRAHVRDTAARLLLDPLPIDTLIDHWEIP